MEEVLSPLTSQEDPGPSGDSRAPQEGRPGPAPWVLPTGVDCHLKRGNEAKREGQHHQLSLERAPGSSLQFWVRCLGKTGAAKQSGGVYCKRDEFHLLPSYSVPGWRVQKELAVIESQNPTEDRNLREQCLWPFPLWKRKVGPAGLRGLPITMHGLSGPHCPAGPSLHSQVSFSPPIYGAVASLTLDPRSCSSSDAFLQTKE